MSRPIAALAAAVVLAAACTDPVAPPPVARPVGSRVPASPASDSTAGPVRTLAYPLSGWTPVGDATFDSGPAAADGYDLARGPDQRLYLAGAFAGSWQPIGDGLTSRPATTSFPVEQTCMPGKPGCSYFRSTYAIAARRDDGNIWVISRRLTDEQWTTW